MEALDIQNQKPQVVLLKAIRDFQNWLAKNRPVKELAVFNLKLQGLKNREIAEELQLSNAQAVVNIWSKVKKLWLQQHPEVEALLG